LEIALYKTFIIINNNFNICCTYSFLRREQFIYQIIFQIAETKRNIEELYFSLFLNCLTLS